jgi:penicillin amidase
MMKFLRILRLTAGGLILLLSLALLGAWWIARRTLPQLDGVVSLPELKEEVTVERDRWGIPRIRARSLVDLVTAEGFVVAQDRLWQMDLLRRVAAGELSEIFGASTLELDRENRTLGLRAAAEREAASMNAEMKSLIEAYARGVNRFILERQANLPIEFQILRYQPRPWTPRDTLLIGAYLHKFLTTTWRWELNRKKVVDKVGPERAREMFIADSPLDHILIGAEDGPGRQPSPLKRPAKAAAPPPTQFAQEQLPAVLESWEEDLAGMFGSNNWVVSGRFTQSGKPLLANDTHMGLDVPCIWYLVQLNAPGWNVRGFALPGSPLVIIGQNDRIAWGFTNNGADVQDLYMESLNPANPNEYRVHGEWRAMEVRPEIIRVKGQADEVLNVSVTRHGPVVARDANIAYALRWTALEPGGLTFAHSLLGNCANWKEFLDVMRRIPGPAQNAVYADVDGNIGYVVAAKIPVRKNGTGEVPAPGETDDFEWTGYIPFEELPVLFNPPEGIIATANARVVGPKYKWHLTDRWVAAYRTDRIYSLLAGRKNLNAADLLAMQTDLLSAPHRILAGHVIQAVRKIPPTDPRIADFAVHLERWNGRATTESTEVSILEFTRRALRRRILETHLGTDHRFYQWFRGDDFIFQVLAQRPAHWLPKEFASAPSTAEGYDRLVLASVEEAMRELQTQSGRSKIAEWPWGRFNQLEMMHPLARSGFARRHLSIGPIPQPGASESVKQTGRSFGPSMRFVADLANPDNSLMNIAMGQSGQYLSRHYRDQFESWYEGKGIVSTFSDAAWQKAAVHHLRLVPQAGPAAHHNAEKKAGALRANRRLR